MTVLERVRRARRRLALLVAGTALLWAAAAGGMVLSLAALIHRLRPLTPGVRLLLIPLLIAAVVAALAVVLWRGRAVRSLESVALWIEEQVPGLRFALVTAMDSAVAPVERHPDLHTQVAAAEIEPLVARAIRRGALRAIGAFLLAAGLVVLARPAALLQVAGRELALRVTPPAAAEQPNRLLRLRAEVVPPAYSRRPGTTLDDPSTIPGLVGSRVMLRGAGVADGITALQGTDTLAAVASGAAWVVGFALPAAPAVLALRDRTYRRLVVLDPRPDSAPTVQLRLPANDTTYQTPPTGPLAIEAALQDDIGLAFAYVEYMVSSGSQESFDTRLSLGPRLDLANRASATLRETIRLDTMKLTPGTVLHLRVVAFDFNDVSGPGRGVSETRTLRIAEPLDSTSINAAPPQAIDSMWVSQRLLNMRTDTLIRTRRRLARETFIDRSSLYSNTQEDIRKRALAVVQMLEDDGVGGTFKTEVSLKLREAADLMFSAREELGIARPDTAMPYMKRVLAILDELRLANRYYLRGLLKPVAVNVERVRLTGKDSAAAGLRTPRELLADARAALAARIGRAAELLPREPQAAMDSLTYARVAALRDAPPVAAALQDVIDRLRRGMPVDSALARTSRALEPPPAVSSGPVEWGGISP